jgi:hypothetical protein
MEEDMEEGTVEGTVEAMVEVMVEATAEVVEDLALGYVSWTHIIFFETVADSLACSALLKPQLGLGVGVGIGI